MQIQRIQSNIADVSALSQRTNRNDVNFCATLKINDSYKQIEESVVEFLEKEFPQKTKKIRGNLNLYVDGRHLNRYKRPHVLSYNNGNGYKDSIQIDFVLSEPKEILLNKLINSIKGFKIREKAVSKMEKLKQEIIELSDKTYKDSENKFKQLFSVVDSSLQKHDIAPKESSAGIIIHR